MHLYLLCWDRFLELQRMRTGGSISTAFRVTVSLSKCTTTASTVNYNKSSKNEESLFPPSPALSSLHCDAARGH